ncbi:hypothetical protein PENSUB_1741 [Penicillium subrubescens]|jgi:hypothetical protein|uniref:Uncharacterized protein n=1 Tax=Penicillium subrubescens TaxID=1316194 RepID=A0A1Q5UJH5_9EURO|nr:hypothetical protein PENSUB_1741 [Penicillium subrubescens]
MDDGDKAEKVNSLVGWLQRSMLFVSAWRYFSPFGPNDVDEGRAGNGCKRRD